MRESGVRRCRRQCPSHISDEASSDGIFYYCTITSRVRPRDGIGSPMPCKLERVDDVFVESVRVIIDRHEVEKESGTV